MIRPLALPCQRRDVLGGDVRIGQFSGVSKSVTMLSTGRFASATAGGFAPRKRTPLEIRVRLQTRGLRDIPQGIVSHAPHWRGWPHRARAGIPPCRVRIRRSTPRAINPAVGYGAKSAEQVSGWICPSSHQGCKCPRHINNAVLLDSLPRSRSVSLSVHGTLSLSIPAARKNRYSVLDLFQGGFLRGPGIWEPLVLGRSGKRGRHPGGLCHCDGCGDE